MRLAAMSLEGGGDPAEFVAEFSGADRPVADYLASEVLVRLPDDVVEFLLRTCVVEELSVDLAARLSAGATTPARCSTTSPSATRWSCRSTATARGSGTTPCCAPTSSAALRRRDPGETSRGSTRLAAQWFLEQARPGRGARARLGRR